uniref:Uncharacterized protein n=1 Tax=Nothobranchius kuhntae TaxID=321403 RepID=A0A1A8IEZ1_NOTKU
MGRDEYNPEYEDSEGEAGCARILREGKQTPDVRGNPKRNPQIQVKIHVSKNESKPANEYKNKWLGLPKLVQSSGVVRCLHPPFKPEFLRSSPVGNQLNPS